MRSVRQALVSTLAVGLLAAPALAAEEATTPDLLPGVDLVTEEVEPGVYRVLSDGTDRGLDDLQMLFVASDGTVWAGRGKRVFRVGVPGASPPLKRGFNRTSFSTADSGNLRAANHLDGLLELRDGRWVELDPDTDKPYPVHPDASEWQGLLPGVGVRGVWAGPFEASDGSWWFGLADPSVPEVLRYTSDGTWERLQVHGAQGTAGQFVETPDGTVWAIAGSGGIRTALFRFDGERWERVVVPDDGTDLDAQSLRLDDQGRLIVNGMLFDTDPPRRVDIVQVDSGWSVTPFVGLADRYPLLAKANLGLLGDDDTGWAIAEDGRFLIYVDDGCATRVDVPFRADAITPSIHRYAVAPDGALWFTIQSDHPSGNSSVGEGLYVITAEAMTVAE